MPGFTPNLNLYKPGGGSTGLITPDEVVDIDRINANMDSIDAYAGIVNARTASLDAKAARLTKTGAQTTSATPGTFTPVTFNTDTMASGMFDFASSPSRVVVPTAGLYFVQGLVRLDAQSTGYANARVAVNGTGVVASEDVRSAQGVPPGIFLRVIDLVQLTAGQYIELQISSTVASTTITLANALLIVKRIA